MQALAFLVSWHCVWPLSKNLKAKVDGVGGLGLKKKKKALTFRGMGKGGDWFRKKNAVHMDLSLNTVGEDCLQSCVVQYGSH